MTSDPDIGFYWRGHSTVSMKGDRRIMAGFRCEATGGTVIYRGRDLKTSHAGLNKTVRQCEIFITHILATLEHFQAPQQEGEEFIACADRLIDETVERP